MNIGMNYISDSPLLEIITRFVNATCILNVCSVLFCRVFKFLCDVFKTN